MSKMPMNCIYHKCSFYGDDHHGESYCDLNFKTKCNKTLMRQKNIERLAFAGIKENGKLMSGQEYNNFLVKMIKKQLHDIANYLLKVNSNLLSKKNNELCAISSELNRILYIIQDVD